ncbi:hypothetical protein BRADI_5g22383v3, partial [Brachypodium distachyon]
MGNSSSSSTTSEANELPPSRSRCTVQRFTTTHDFQLANYRLLLDAAAGMDAGWFRESGTFRIGGHSWNIRLFPNGSTEGLAGNASVFLYFLSVGPGNLDVSTRFSMNVVEKEGRPKLTDFPLLDSTFSPASYEFNRGVNAPSPPVLTWGYRVFFKNSDLMPCSHLDDNGTLTVRCVITVIKKSRTKLKTHAAVAPPQPNFQDHLGQMLKDGLGRTVTFNVGGQVFRAHKCLLAARSPVFRAELFGPTKEEESAQCIIQIDDMEPSIFEALLHFLYTDCVTDDYRQGKTENLQHLMVVADRIKTKTVATTLVLAQQHGCRALKKACVEFIMASGDRLRAVRKTDGFSHLLASCPRLVKQI